MKMKIKLVSLVMCLVVLLVCGCSKDIISMDDMSEDGDFVQESTNYLQSESNLETTEVNEYQEYLNSISPKYVLLDTTTPGFVGRWFEKKVRGINHTLVDNWRDLDVIKIVLRVYPHIFHEVYRAIKNKFDGLLSPTYSCDNVIDIQMNGVNKGNALREMTESHFKRDVKLIACGDYVNDIEMLDRADLSVCPENAHSEVKKICDLKLCKNTDGLIDDLVSHIEKILDRGISL